MSDVPLFLEQMDYKKHNYRLQNITSIYSILLALIVT
jgi:hypothetical protein